MIENDFRKNKSLSTLTIAEVSMILNHKHDRTTRRWLKNMGIAIHQLSKKSYVYQLDLDFVLDKPYVMDLKRKHPQKWKEMYRCVVKDESLYKLMVFEVDKMTSFTPLTRVSIKNESDKKLFKSLLL